MRMSRNRNTLLRTGIRNQKEPKILLKKKVLISNIFRELQLLKKIRFTQKTHQWFIVEDNSQKVPRQDFWNVNIQKDFSRFFLGYNSVSHLQSTVRLIGIHSGGTTGTFSAVGKLHWTKSFSSEWDKRPTKSVVSSWVHSFFVTHPHYNMLHRFVTWKLAQIRRVTHLENQCVSGGVYRQSAAKPLIIIRRAM